MISHLITQRKQIIKLGQITKEKKKKRKIGRPEVSQTRHSRLKVAHVNRSTNMHLHAENGKKLI